MGRHVKKVPRLTAAPSPGPPTPRGTDVFYPIDLEREFRISHVTRWNWERKGYLPKRDFFVNDEPVGWRRATLTDWQDAQAKRAAAREAASQASAKRAAVR